MELIYKQEVIKLLRGKCVAKYPSTFTMGLFAAADEIAKLPEVDAKPVVCGSWVENKWAEEYEDQLISNYECSVCHEWFRGKSNYCPYCGAKMNEDG